MGDLGCRHHPHRAVGSLPSRGGQEGYRKVRTQHQILLGSGRTRKLRHLELHLPSSLTAPQEASWPFQPPCICLDCRWRPQDSQAGGVGAAQKDICLMIIYLIGIIIYSHDSIA
jgi:hypothetical protein